MRHLLPCLALAATPLAAEPVQVVADIPPVAALVAAVQGGRGTVASVVEGAGDPHHVALRPSQARALADADLAVWIGPALDAWFGEARDRLAPGAPSLTLLDQAGLRLPRRAAEPDHDDHDHKGDTDPHAWLAPENAATWLSAIADTLAAADPDGADAYRANATAEIAAIHAVTAEIAATAKARPAFTYLADHDSLHYAEALARASFAGALSDSHATAPGPAHLAELERLIDQQDVACIVTTGGDTTRLASRIAADHDLPLVALDTRNAGESYTSWLTELHSTFASCVIVP